MRDYGRTQRRTEANKFQKRSETQYHVTTRRQPDNSGAPSRGDLPNM
jgi:hypothetical protein